jgi:GNAT superfamily N-acetyltransferase
MKTGLSKPEVARSLETNFINTFKNVHGVEGVVFSQTDSVAKFVSGFPVPWLNCVFWFDANGQDLKEQIKGVLSEFKDRHCPMYWFVGVLTPRQAAVKNALVEVGLTSASDYVGLVLEPSAFHASAPKPELKIEIVSGSKKIRHWVEPVSVCFSLPNVVRKYSLAYGQRRLGESSNEFWFTTYLDGSPISTAAYVIDAGVILIHSVATLPAYRGQGYARATMEAAISHALNQVQLPLVAYSAPEGLELYKKIGFSEVYRMQPFESQ